MTDTEHQSELDETLMKIGRKVLHFQRMEAFLKFLIARSKLEGTASDLRENHKKNVDAVSRQTMGNLDKSFVESVCSEPNDEEVPVTENEQAWFAFLLKTEADREYIEQCQATLGTVVEGRNSLIHQMLKRLDQTSTESCRELSDQLDAQAESVRPEYEALRNLIQAFLEGREEGFGSYGEKPEK